MNQSTSSRAQVHRTCLPCVSTPTVRAGASSHAAVALEPASGSASCRLLQLLSILILSSSTHRSSTCLEARQANQSRGTSTTYYLLTLSTTDGATANWPTSDTRRPANLAISFGASFEAMTAHQRYQECWPRPQTSGIRSGGETADSAVPGIGPCTSM